MDSPDLFAQAIRGYARLLGGSISSWGRTRAHNATVGGVADSPHLAWLGADVVYDAQPELERAVQLAQSYGLALVRESDHDHLQPLGWHGLAQEQRDRLIAVNG